MNRNIRPIETHYRGYRFRSRLEARWAVFFDAIGLKWEYEIEGYQLSSGWYLPDFFFPTIGDFAEVKPTTFADHEIQLCRELSECTEAGVVLLDGTPDLRVYYRISSQEESMWGIHFGLSMWSDFAQGWFFSFEDGNHWRPERLDEGLEHGFKVAVVKARSARFEHGERG